MNVVSNVVEFMPLLTHAEAPFILGAAHTLAITMGSTQTINAAVDRVSKIVTTLKTFSQDSAVGEMREANLRDGIEAVLARYANQIKQGTHLVRQYEELPPIRCVPEELGEVWTHLIHNALQAMDTHGTLTITLKQVGSDALVVVSDTGHGIADEIRPRIFEPFFSTRRVGEGAGLGLDIVRKIVAKHNGRIEVQTQVGVGSSFSIHLPYANSP